MQQPMLQRTLARLNSSSPSLQHWLLVSCAFSLLLVGVRVVATGYFTYLFLVWNLFLAFIPYLISQRLSNNVRLIENRFMLLAATLAWLLFIPNSFYILTDLFHLGEFDAAPKWFDLLLIFSFAWNGLLLGILSMQRMEMILELAGGKRFSLPVIALVMWLNAFGIYIGRYLRYNSWDIITQPFSLFGELFAILLHPLRNKMEWGMISVYAVFMLLLYGTIRKLGEHLRQPLK
jgi:uncharacterized membrane protein